MIFLPHLKVGNKFCTLLQIHYVALLINRWIYAGQRVQLLIQTTESVSQSWGLVSKNARISE